MGRKTLRPRQALAIDKLRDALRSGIKRLVLKAPTGFGKTVVAAEIIHTAIAKGKRVHFVVDAITLVDQTARSFYEQGITDIGVIQADHEMTNPNAMVQVCSQATLMRRRHLPHADLVLIDECFPAGTKISTPKGDTPIEFVNSGDLVYNAAGIGTVRAISTRLASELVEVEIDNGTKIRCTGNHPFFTGAGWIEASKLEGGSIIFCKQGVSGMQQNIRAKTTMERGISERGGGNREVFYEQSYLLTLLREEVEKPDAQRVNKRKAKADAEADWAQTFGSGRQRKTNEPAAAFAAGSFGAWLEGRGGDSNRAEGADISNPLQNRYCQQRVDAGDRSGRSESSGACTQSARQEEGFVFGEQRVVRVSRVESGGAQAVFNLSVSGHPSYFAGGALVHNCHIFYKFYSTWMEKWDQIPFIGLSATPYTKGLGKHFQQLISTATTQELIDEGSLSDFKVWAPSAPDLSKVKIVAGDYSEDQLAEIMNQADLVGDIVEKWKQLADNRPTFCYAVDRAHARAIQRRFQEAGIEFEYIDAYTTREERDVIKKQFHDGCVAGVVSVGCLVKGVDWDVRCIILARPTKSDSLYQQIIGRGLRTAPGKDYCLIIDHTGTTLRLGFVTDVDDRHTALDMSKKQKNAPQEKVIPLPKECPQCKFVKPVKVWECPNCGYKPERQPVVVQAAGELAELTRAQKQNNKHASATDKAFFYGEAIVYGRERGRKDGWAANLYRSRFGVWPNKITPFMRAPTPETLNYIKAMNIRYAKGKGAANV